MLLNKSVIPAKAGIHESWIPAFAGMILVVAYKVGLD